MSDFSDIGQAILDIWEATIPGLTGHLEFVAYDALTPGDMPATITVEVLERSTELVALQEAKVITFTFAQVSEGTDTPSMWTDLDAVRDALFADRTLGGRVDKLFIPERAVPPPPSDNRMIGTLDVTVEFTQ